MPLLAFRIFDPGSCHFPRPRLPMLPRFGAATPGEATEGFQPLSQRPGARFHYARGRYALCEAYRLSGVGHGGALLAPAYHCRTMLDPAMRLDAPILLYPSDHALRPDYAALARLHDKSPTPVRALLLTHYFGFAQDVAAARAFCDARGMRLIEDCSHAFLDSADGVFGRHSDYCVASPYKFLPSPDGGLLLCADGAPQPQPPDGAPLRAELSGLSQLIAGMRWQAPPHYADTGDGVCGSDTLVEQDTVSYMYRPADEGRAALRLSRVVMNSCDIDGLATRRRRNYAYLADRLAGMAHGRPLIPELPAHCVPYMLPFLIDHPDPHFFALKRRSMPIWRWDEMAVSECGVATDYRLRLLHLPCHQSLAEADLDWMADTIGAVLAAAPASA